MDTKRNYFKVKVALFFGYDGSKYKGLQQQKDDSIETVEKYLFQALKES